MSNKHKILHKIKLKRFLGMNNYYQLIFVRLIIITDQTI